MLIRFNVSNFLSFDKETEFNMLTGSVRNHEYHVYKAGKVDVLKSAAIYGANGAGKSNLIKAMKLLQDTVTTGKVPRGLQNRKFRLNKDNQQKPISFEIEFSVAKKIYSYGFSVDNNTVIEEWLYESGITTEDKLIFERKRNKIKVADKFLKTQKAKLRIEVMEDFLESDGLLLSSSKSLGIKDIVNAKQWIENSLVVLFPESKFRGLVRHLSKSDKFKCFANELLQTFDTGVNELKTAKIDFEKFFGEEDEDVKNDILEELDENSSILLHSYPQEVLVSMEKGERIVEKVISIHKDVQNSDVVFELDNESDGTLRLLDFIPAFDVVLQEDVTFIIDEIDQSLHPMLLYSLVRKIMDDTTTKGQFIFTTHEANLLDLKIFRQDEIWFAEKEKKTGSTHFYPLSDFKPRNDLDIRKGYLNGRFGAIPFLANLKDLNWHTHGA